MFRIRPSCILALAALLATNHAAAIPPMAPATTDRVSVTAAPTTDADACGYDIRCEVAGGVLSIDRNYIGAVPRSGSLPPGGHYFELHLPGYDDIGFWLTLEKATNYTISFDPAGRIRLFAAKDEVSVTTEPTLNAGQSDLILSSSIRGATLLMDKALIGTIPKAGSSPGGLTLVATPGSHFLELSAPGYYDLETWLLFEERTKYTIVLNPARITGFLSIEVEPPDASLSLDGGDIGRGLTEVPAGTHSLSIKRFGFVERSLTVVVQARTTSFVSLSLQKAVFTIGGLGFSRSVFNPRNSGAPGRTSLDFRATNSGSAVAEIRGPGGNLVATLDFPDIATWDQSLIWNGRAADGSVLPDGIYSVTLRAKPALGVPTLPKGPPDGTVELRAEGRIDSTLVVRSFGTASAVPGLLFMPDPLSQPAGTLAAEASWFEPWGMPQASAFGLSSAISLGGRV
ncbi:MAG: PEGA domain-containing protein, partial [Spirochaetota bacterium]